MGKKLSNVFGGSSAPKVQKIAAPEIQKPAPMPDEEAIDRAAAVSEAKRKKGGRSATLLTDESFG